MKIGANIGERYDPSCSGGDGRAPHILAVEFEVNVHVSLLSWQMLRLGWSDYT